MRGITMMTVVAAIVCGHAAGAELPTLAIVDFTTEQRVDQWDLAAKLQRVLDQRVVNSGLFDVVERTKLGSVMGEQMWQQGGFVDPASAVALGQQLGARFLLTGSVIDADTEQRSIHAYGANIQTSTMRVTAVVKVIDLEKNKIVAAFEEEGTAQIHEGQGLDVRNSKVFTDLTRELADRFIADLRQATFLAAYRPESREKVQITIQSEPAGADVELDGVFIGNANATVSVEHGVHDIAVSLPGYDTWRKKVAVSNGMTFTANLKKLQDADLKLEVVNKAE